MVSPSSIFEPKRAWMTWAPSHPELALLSELLHYANRINGLKEEQKNKIRLDLEGKRFLHYSGFESTPLDEFMVAESQPKALLRGISYTSDRKLVIYPTDSGELSSFAELCPEYIDFLKSILKPYL